MVQMLKSRYQQDAGNGPAGAVIPQVRNDAGFDAKRTLDAIAVSFWPSRGLLLEGFECKSSRSDWQRELKDPSKAEEFCEKLDKFWIVAGAKGVVLEDELPPDWGLLVVRGTKLVQVRPAKLLREVDGKRGRRALPPSFDRGFLIALLRQATFMQRVTPEGIEAARRRGFDEGQQVAQRNRRDYEQRWKDLQAEVREFEQTAGISIRGLGWPKRTAEQVGAAVKTVLAGEHETEILEQRLRRVFEDASKIAERAGEQLAQVQQSGEVRRVA